MPVHGHTMLHDGRRSPMMEMTQTPPNHPGAGYQPMTPGMMTNQHTGRRSPAAMDFPHRMGSTPGGPGHGMGQHRQSPMMQGM